MGFLPPTPPPFPFPSSGVECTSQESGKVHNQKCSSTRRRSILTSRKNPVKTGLKSESMVTGWGGQVGFTFYDLQYRSCPTWSGQLWSESTRPLIPSGLPATPASPHHSRSRPHAVRWLLQCDGQSKFISKHQKTCKYLIHAYSEAPRLKLQVMLLQTTATEKLTRNKIQVNGKRLQRSCKTKDKDKSQLPTDPFENFFEHCLETSSYCVLRCVLRRATWSSSLPVPTCSYLFLPTWPYLALIRRYLKVCVETCYLVIFTTCSYLFLPVPTYLALPGPNTSLLKGVC